VLIRQSGMSDGPIGHPSVRVRIWRLWLHQQAATGELLSNLMNYCQEAGVIGGFVTD
jgi:hypothetical protein